MIRFTTRFVLFVVCTAVALPYGYAQTDKPNIVVLMVDNLGWGELGCYGGGELRGAATPRLDQLAREGMRLLNYNVETQCTPSRSAFMTGRYAVRSGTSKVVWGMLYGMTQWERTIPELLSDEGYATGMFGKWHLGDTKGRFPTDQGFDEWYGIANTTDESLYTSQFQYDKEVSVQTIIQQSSKGQTPELVSQYNVPERRKIDSELVRRSVDFMKRNVDAKKPFFTYIPFTQPHMPTLPHPDFDGKTGEGFYADVIAEIDHRAGQVLDAIDDLGIRDNTIVIWTSDNGPEAYYPWHGTAGFWRGTYFTALEGSLRVGFLARWPGKIKPGSTSNEIVHTVDILPTLARIAGAKIPDDRIIDGVDQLDFLTGKQDTSNREGFPVYNGDDMFAYKWRNWKMHFMQLDNMRGIPQKTLMPKLHHLIKDPKEEHDIAAEATWVMPVIMKRIVAFQKSLVQEPPIKLGTPDPYAPPKK